ncbi:hypothetical protein V1478_004820, partial [Vespula squamosa]
QDRVFLLKRKSLNRVIVFERIKSSRVIDKKAKRLVESQPVSHRNRSLYSCVRFIRFLPRFNIKDDFSFLAIVIKYSIVAIRARSKEKAAWLKRATIRLFSYFRRFDRTLRKWLLNQRRRNISSPIPHRHAYANRILCIFIIKVEKFFALHDKFNLVFRQKINPDLGRCFSGGSLGWGPWAWAFRRVSFFRYRKIKLSFLLFLFFFFSPSRISVLRRRSDVSSKGSIHNLTTNTGRIGRTLVRVSADTGMSSVGLQMQQPPRGETWVDSTRDISKFKSKLYHTSTIERIAAYFKEFEIAIA